jgi:hypothetical protein
VLVHIHDIMFPFEYPEAWFPSGRALNEAYMVRAFLLFNNRFRIIFWNNYLRICDAEWLGRTLPDCLRGWTTSLWLCTTDGGRS